MERICIVELADMKNVVNLFFADKSGKLVFGQIPNAPIIVWGVFTIISLFADGDLSDLAGWIAKTGLILWAILEIYSGVNLFRKILGATVLGATVYGIIF